MTEHNNRKNKPHATSRLGSYAKTTIKVLGILVGLTAIIAFPGLAIVVREFTRHTPRGRRYSKYHMREAIKRLEERAYIRVVKKNDELFMQLTPEGRQALKKIRIETLVISTPLRWDGFWRFVAFDIPEEKRRARAMFRAKLYEFGFVKVQRSLFAYPYPCEKEVAAFAEYSGISSFVQCIVAKSFNGDKSMRSRFGILHKYPEAVEQK